MTILIRRHTDEGTPSLPKPNGQTDYLIVDSYMSLWDIACSPGKNNPDDLPVVIVCSIPKGSQLRFASDIYIGNVKAVAENSSVLCVGDNVKIQARNITIADQSPKLEIGQNVALIASEAIEVEIGFKANGKTNTLGQAYYNPVPTFEGAHNITLHAREIRASFIPSGDVRATEKVELTSPGPGDFCIFAPSIELYTPDPGIQAEVNVNADAGKVRGAHFVYHRDGFTGGMVPNPVPSGQAAVLPEGLRIEKPYKIENAPRLPEFPVKVEVPSRRSDGQRRPDIPLRAAADLNETIGPIVKALKEIAESYSKGENIAAQGIHSSPMRGRVLWPFKHAVAGGDFDLQTVIDKTLEGAGLTKIGFKALLEASGTSDFDLEGYDLG